MRRIQALLLCVVLLMGGCKTLHAVGEVVAAGAFLAGAVLLNHHYHHGYHGFGHHGHHGHNGH